MDKELFEKIANKAELHLGDDFIKAESKLNGEIVEIHFKASGSLVHVCWAAVSIGRMLKDDKPDIYWYPEE